MADYPPPIGPNSTLSDNTSKVFGSTIRADGMQRVADVYGQGSFEHEGGTVDTEGTSDALVTVTVLSTRNGLSVKPGRANA